MNRLGSFFLRGVVLLLWCGLFLYPNRAAAQGEPQGRPIGAVSTDGKLIVLELNDGVLGKANLFDLAGRTLRFTPEAGKYRVENTALQWDADFGPEAAEPAVALHNFEFPFSGKTWKSFQVGTTGSISFGESSSSANSGRGPRGQIGGVSISRFDELSDGANSLVNTIPAICVFFKPRMTGPHYVKELQDRVVVTWDISEPFGNIQDFTWFKTVNRFQAVLHRDGSIEMSYNQLAAKDAIVGVYPMLPGVEKVLATLSAGPHPELAAHLDVRNLKISVVDGLVVKVTFETRGPALAEGDAALEGARYRVFLMRRSPRKALPLLPR